MSFLRLWQITKTISSYRLDEPLNQTSFFNPFKILRILLPWWSFHASRSLDYSQRLHNALESLGPLPVKFGQILSTRRDLLPLSVADALANLQDNVAPFDSREALSVVESALNQPIEKAFSYFDPTPIAAASIAQVHVALLPNEQKVAVKILRPGIHRAVEKDLKVLSRLAKLAERFIPAARRFRPCELVTELRTTLGHELDLRQEAANASLLARNFENNDLIHVPKVYFEYSRANLMVSEYINGIPIADNKQLAEKNIDRKMLAERGVEIFFTQAFEHCFFHADMHPGNIFINPDRPEDPQYMAVDFGIMGTLSPKDQYYLAENFLAFFNRDYRRVAILHVRSGWAPKDTNIEAFTATIRTLCEPIWGKPISEISFAQSLMQLLQASREFQIEVQPQLLLLQKTLFNIEGLGRELYPGLDLWDTAKPFLEKWMKKKRHPKNLYQYAKKEMPFLISRFLKDDLEAPADKPSPPKQASAVPVAWLALVGVAALIWREPLQALIAENPNAWLSGIAGFLAAYILLRLRPA